MNRWFRAWLIIACFVLVLLFLLGPIQQISVVTGQGGDPRKPKPTRTPSPSTKSSGQPLGKRAQPNTTRGEGTTMPRTRTNQVGIELVLIPAGEFMMGSTNGRENEEPVHRVKISQSFYMGKYEVTQAQWQSVMRNNPSYFKNCDSCPVEQVSWDDAQQFLAKLNERNDGYTYRLPSEAEWEYACRAGTTADYAGDDLDSMAWFANNAGNSRLDADAIWRAQTNYSKRLVDNGNKTHPVGSKQPNAWGLYDMRGNVWEWCQDWYHDSYNGAPTDGSAWPNGGERKYHVLRGGSWSYVATGLRSPFRYWVTPTVRDGGRFGFRVVTVR
jgi:formylglycine-generating enzyme required for sulfatase activity